MSAVVPIASIEPDSKDHFCSGLRALQAIAGDNPDWADFVGGMQAYREDENCALMQCPPFKAASANVPSDGCSVITISDDDAPVTNSDVSHMSTNFHFKVQLN
jgi:hypothetical protein